MIKVLIADDQTLMRDGLKMIIELESDMKVIATAENGLEALALTEKYEPDLILMDIQMPVMNGIESLQEIKKRHRDTRVLILTTFADDDYIIQGLTLGADGFLLKDMSQSQLIAAVRDAAKGHMMIPHVIAQKLAQQLIGRLETTPPSLAKEQLKLSGIKFSRREEEVAVLLAKGLSNKKIAQSLFISEGTVKNYISEIYSKLHVNDRAEAIVFLNKYDLT